MKEDGKEGMTIRSNGKSTQLRCGLFLPASLLLLSALNLCACSVTPMLHTSGAEPAPALVTNLHDHVAKLTREPPRCAANEASLDRAAGYIAEAFKKTGCRMEEQPVPVDDRTYRNIICSFGPVDGERIVLGAHYDVDQKGTPGADDNASGVAGILELARMASKDETFLAGLTGLNRRLDLIAYTLEEEPYFSRQTVMGSYRHAESLYKHKVPVRLMMSLEMIGYYTKEYPAIPLDFLYHHEGTYIAVVGTWEQHHVVSRVRDLMAKQSAIDVVSFTAPSFLPTIYLSDQRNYWEFYYPAVMVTDTADMRNFNYHKAADTIDTLNFKSMANVVDAVYSVITGY